jgi:hypothetical protein
MPHPTPTASVIRQRSDQVYLCSHPALLSFVDHWKTLADSPSSHPKGAIVCERKEDVMAVRAQVFAELKKHNPSGSAIGGLSTYTLDGLGRSLCQWLHLALKARDHAPGAERQPKETQTFGQLASAELAQTYLDTVTQEKLVRHVLLALGYSGSDALPLAKQILTLIDHPLPEGVTLLECLTPLQRSGFKGTIDEAQLSSFPVLICALQVAQVLLDKKHFIRLQTLLLEGFAKASDESVFDLVHSLTPIVPFLSGPMLWVEAPRYGWTDTPEDDLYKPGNFDARIVQDLFTSVHMIRDRTATAEGPHPTFVAEIHIQARPHNQSPRAGTAPSLIDEPQPVVRVVNHGNLLHFYKETERVLGTQDALVGVDWSKDRARACVLRGDVSLEPLRALDPFAAGRYPVSAAESDAHLSADPVRQGTMLVAAKAALDNLASEVALLEEMLAAVEHDLERMSHAYGLRGRLTHADHRFRVLARDLSFRIQDPGQSHPLEELPQALALVASLAMPSAIVIFGKPHLPKQASYNVRLLNQIFFELQKRGAAVALPASDLMYRVFWHSLFQGPHPVELHLVDAQETEELVWFENCRFDIIEPPKVTTWRPSSAGLKALERNATLMERLTNPSSQGHSGDQPRFLAPQWAATRDHIRVLRKRAQGGAPIDPAISTSSKRPPWLTSTQLPHAVTLSMTAFENYMQCPMQFYLQHVLCLSDESDDSLAHDRRATGTRTHRTLELLSTSLSLLRSTGRDKELMTALSERFLADWYEQLKIPEVFCSVDGQSFLLSAKKTIEHLRTSPDFTSKLAQRADPDDALTLFQLSLEEVVSSVFSGSVETFVDMLDLEARKRLLLAFLHGESVRLHDDQMHGLSRQLAAVEEPLHLVLESPDGRRLELEGTADRLDVVYKNGQEAGDSNGAGARGLKIMEIVDYKTSRPRDEVTQLLLFPGAGAAPKGNRGMNSAQGGLYLAALMERQRLRHQDTDQDDAAAPLIYRFSLFRLGSLKGKTHPILSATIDLQNDVDRENLGLGLDMLRQRATQLLDGDFSPRPDQVTRCQTCTYQLQCPGVQSTPEESP